MIELVKSDVVFNEDDHTYFLGDKQLKGITGMIKRHLFPGKYSEVPKYIMERAADRGSRVHRACEFVDTTGFGPECCEAERYLAIRTDAGYSPLANEYTVSDNEHFASNIDCVWEREGSIALADIKTTYDIDREYLSWQLSIYAYLFEMQNPLLKVDRLFGVWLYKSEKREISELIEIVRKPDEEVVRLMECEVAGIMYSVTSVQESDVPRLVPKEVVGRYLEACDIIDEVSAFANGFKDTLKKSMVDNRIRTWEYGGIRATVTPESISKGFDVKRFQSDHPELYRKYIKETVKPSSIRITRKDESE